MTHIITEQLSITPLNSALLPCPTNEATYQREKYNADGLRTKIVSCISEYTNKFSYSVGETVDIIPHLYLTRYYRINNLVTTNRFAREKLNQGR